MKYRIVQYLEHQYEDYDGDNFIPVSAYKYIAQRRYKWWPIWFDLCFGKDSMEEAKMFIDADVERRRMQRVIIHDIDLDKL